MTDWLTVRARVTESERESCRRAKVAASEAILAEEQRVSGQSRSKAAPEKFHVSSQLQLGAPKTMERKITLVRTYVSKPHFCRLVAELPLNSRDFTDMQPWTEYATGIEERGRCRSGFLRLQLQQLHAMRRGEGGRKEAEIIIAARHHRQRERSSAQPLPEAGQKRGHGWNEGEGGEEEQAGN